MGSLTQNGAFYRTVHSAIAKLLDARLALHQLVVVDVVGLGASLRVVFEAFGLGAEGTEVAVVVHVVWVLFVAQLII